MASRSSALISNPIGATRRPARRHPEPRHRFRRGHSRSFHRRIQADERCARTLRRIDRREPRFQEDDRRGVAGADRLRCRPGAPGRLEEMGWPPPDTAVVARASRFPDVERTRAAQHLGRQDGRAGPRELGRSRDLRPRRSSTFATCSRRRLYKAPPDCVDVPTIAKAHARRLAVEWLEQKSRVLWPLASPEGPIRLGPVVRPKGRTGEDRIDYQVIKANVDPWACCAGSPAGSTRWRLQRRRFRVRPSLSRRRLDRQRVQCRMHRGGGDVRQAGRARDRRDRPTSSTARPSCISSAVSAA